MGYVVQTPILNAEHHNPHTHNLHTLPLQDNILQEPCQSQVDRDSVGDLEEDFLADSLNKAVEEDFQVDSLNKAAEVDFREVFLEEPVADSQAQAEGNPADFLALAEGDPADFQEELGVILHKVDLEEVIPHNKAVEEVSEFTYVSHSKIYSIKVHAPIIQHLISEHISRPILNIKYLNIHLTL